MKTIFLLVCLLVAVLFSSIAHGQTTYKFTYDSSGNRELRTVIVMKSATISADSLEAKKAVMPLDDQIGLQKTRIYPNPTKGLLRIDFPSLVNQEANIRVHDSLGKLIVQQSGALSNEVDLSAYPSGFYIMIIRIGQDKKEWKIIKE